MIAVTEQAARHIKKIQIDTAAADKFLRVAVVGGGCSGNQYRLGFDEQDDNDTKVESNGVSIIVDQQSWGMLDGIEIDYTEGLQGSGFVFNNPNATSGCGCGKSFSC